MVDPAEGEVEVESKAGLGNLLGALRVNSLKSALAGPMQQVDKKKLIIPDSLKKTEALPFSPRKPFAQWSPRTVAQQTLDYIGQDETQNSPLRKLCRDSVEKTLPVRAIVHHIDVDPMKVKKSTTETTLHNVTTVNRRTQRALTAEEVAENCEKSIEFFRQAKETNQKMEEMFPGGMFPKKGSAWAKMREKSKMRGKLEVAGAPASGAASRTTTRD
ncbi:unnamed protein product [Amoebophrya sp. A25]|nr:unnamed protein product [Amoebophrya sp. A25]|eukprot:GSA25T00012172001.1